MVLGGDSRSKSCEFESQNQRLDDVFRKFYQNTLENLSKCFHNFGRNFLFKFLKIEFLSTNDETKHLRRNILEIQLQNASNEVFITTMIKALGRPA